MANNIKEIQPSRLHDPLTFFIVLGIFIGVMILYGFVIQEEEPQVYNSVTITTWLDTNKDGIRDASEPPLGNVCLWVGNPNTATETIFEELNSCSQRSGHDGILVSDIFLDAFCNQLASYAKPPDGYILTTEYFARGCKIKFGFVQESTP